MSQPEVGAKVTKDSEYGELESTKAVSALISPLSGEVVEVNDALEGSENTINDEPYGDGWLIKVRMSDPAELDTLLDAAAYKALVDSL